MTFVEGTAAKIGDAIASNTNHTLTWDVGADWNIDLGQVKFEILARDGRGLLAFDWITIPAAGGNPALTISKDAPSDAAVLDALFWLYASGDPGLTLTEGTLTGNANSGNFTGVELSNSNSVANFVQHHAPAFIFKRMNLDPATYVEVNHAGVSARAGLVATTKWHAANRPYAGISIISAWGHNLQGQANVPAGVSSVKAIAARGFHSLALNRDGTVFGWGRNDRGQTTTPAGLIGVTAVSAGYEHSLALKSDGSVVGWPDLLPWAKIPAGLTDVIAVSAAAYHSLALKSDGSAIAWGESDDGQTKIPDGLTGVTAIAAGTFHNLALKSDGTVVCWPSNNDNAIEIPAGLNKVIAIAAGYLHSLALKSDGTVVAWGSNGEGQTAIPEGLNGVTAISAGDIYSLALKSDGTVVAWGATRNNWSGQQTTIPVGLSGVTAIAAGAGHSLALRAKAP